MKKKYYPACIESTNSGTSGYFVKNINNNKVLFLNKVDTELITNLTGCRTLEEHYEAIKNNEKYNISDSIIKKLLNSWIESGLLRDEELLTDNKAVMKNRKSPVLISGCITFCRPDYLERSLISKINADEFKNLKPPIIICDDTESGLLKDKNENIIKRLKKEYSGGITYLDNNEKKSLADKILKTAAESIPKDIVHFALNLSEYIPIKSQNTGGNRNALTLASAGANLYSSDDDIEYKVFSDPNDDSRYHFSSELNNHPEFFPDMTIIENIIGKQIRKNDLLTLFNDYTGKDPRDIENSDSIISYHDIPPEISAAMESRDLKIKIITTGFYGGRWYKNPHFPILQYNDEQEHYFNNPENYRKIINNGLNILKHDKKSFDRGSYFIAGNFCMDNTELPSLCLPQGRRQDLVFAEILNSCLESGLKLSLPHIIFHNHSVKEKFKDFEFSDTALQIGDYSTRIINRLSSSLINQPGKKRLKELGFRIKEFSKINYKDFLDQLKLMQLTSITETMNQITYLLDLYDNNPAWRAEDLNRYYELLKQEALSKDSVVPKELIIIRDTEKALNIFKDYLFKCGELLEWWPEIWESAKNLNLEGKGFVDLSGK